MALSLVPEFCDIPRMSYHEACAPLRLPEYALIAIAEHWGVADEEEADRSPDQGGATGCSAAGAQQQEDCAIGAATSICQAGKHSCGS